MQFQFIIIPKFMARRKDKQVRQKGKQVSNFTEVISRKVGQILHT